MNIYIICTLWTPFQAERDWKISYREILLIPLYIFYSLCIGYFVIYQILKSKTMFDLFIGCLSTWHDLWSIVSANRTHSQLPLPPSPGSGSEWLSEWGREGSDTWSNEEKGVVGLVLVLKALKIQDSFFN